MRGTRSIRERHDLPELGALDPALARVSRWEITLSLLVPWACLTIYLLAASMDWWPLAVLGVVLLSFFTYGSISHDLVHGNLGLPRRMNDLLLCMTELLAVRSGHAYQAAHLHHHARFPAEDDIEGAASGMSLTSTVLDGLTLQPRIWLWALRHRRGRRGWILFEGAVCLLIVTGSLVLIPTTALPIVYVALVITGSWIIPLVTSYIPHDAHADQPLQQTRLFRGRLLSLIAIEHLYHLEHHLYPQVPHQNWARLAKRLDPLFQKAGIEPIRLDMQHGRAAMQTPSDDPRGLFTILIGDGRPLITLTGLSLLGSGLFAGFQAATGHLLPHDEAFLGMGAHELRDLQDGRVLHFMIHDRIAFGGALVGIGMLYLYLAAVPLARGRV